MKSRSCVFNGFLALASLALVAGCCTSEECKRSKEMSTLRVHLESDRGSNDRGSAISVIRSSPLKLNIDREPVLEETSVTAARLVEEAGDLFSIEVQFDRRGTWALERTTASSKGKRLVIFSDFGIQSRWLAAYMITAKNSSGRLTFTPDATREEAERIVRGLNNFAKEQDSKSAWPFAPAPER